MAVDELVEKDTTEAGGTSSETPAETEPSTAEGDGQQESGDGQPEKGKTSQETSSTGDPDDDGPEPDKNKPVPHKQWADMRDRRNRYRDKVTAFQKVGISTPEDAEFLKNEADQLSALHDRMADPAGFFEWYEAEYPKQAAELIEALRPEAVDTGAVVTSELRKYAKAFRKRGGDGDADAARLLDDIADSHETAKPERSEKPTETKADRTDDSGERVWRAFSREVTGELDRGFKEAINDLTKEAGFKNDEQRELFTQTVVRDLNRAMEADPVFIKRRDAAQHARLGHTSKQAQDAARLYLSWAKAEGRLESIVRKHADNFGLGKKAAPALKAEAGRREVSGAGVAAGASGKLSDEQSVKLKADIANAGYTGADAMTEYIKRKNSLLGRK